MRTGRFAAVIALAILLAAPAADASRVRRPPRVEVTGVPKICSGAFVASVSVSGHPEVDEVEVALDGRVVRRSEGDVRVDCGRLRPGRHEIRVVARNPKRTTVVAEFGAR